MARKGVFCYTASILTPTPMLRALARFLVVVGLFSLSFAVLAQEAGVRNLSASVLGGAVIVRWQPPADDSHTASYRVYYSGRSILNNDGEYDDYETSTGKATQVTLREYPRQSGELFIAVLSVDEEGREMDTFTSETRVSLSGVPAVTASSAQAAQPAAATKLTLREVRSTSVNSVTLVFSHAVNIAPTDAANAFRAEDGSGQPLQLTRLTIQGSEVRLNTAAQRTGVTYRVHANPVIYGSGPSGERLPLDTTQSSLTFAGGSGQGAGQTGTPAGSVTPAQAQTPGAVTPSDVRNLEMRAEKQRDGTYLVIAAWDLQGSVANAIQVRQTRDGVTYGEPHRVPGSATHIRFQQVQPGRFGILVQAIAREGTVSTGAFTSVMLAGRPTTKTDLTDSGPVTGLMGVLAVSGAGAGWLWMRKRGLAV